MNSWPSPIDRAVTPATAPEAMNDHIDHAITARVCSCCGKARWHCPSCATPGHWPMPLIEPTWPVCFEGACPRCKATVALRITGIAPARPELSALERALRLPPASPQRRQGKGK